MAEIQYIPKDWDKRIETHIAAMEAANKAALAKQPGPEHQNLWDTYEAVCRDFLDHLSNLYGSADGFTSFLREDVSRKLSAAGLSENIIGDEGNWQASFDEEWQTANKAASVYKNMYLPLVESAAHKVAFHHAKPSFDL